MNGLINVGYFLFSSIFSLFIFILWARLALRYFKVSVLNPMSYSIYQFTTPFITPVAKLFSSSLARNSRIDWPCFSVLCLVELIKFVILGLFVFGTIMPIPYLIMYVIADLIVQPSNLLFYAILIRIILSWVNPSWRHPLNDLLIFMTEPSLKFARNLIPDIAGIDLSPMLALILLKIITILVQSSLPIAI